LALGFAAIRLGAGFERLDHVGDAQGRLARAGQAAVLDHRPKRGPCFSVCRAEGVRKVQNKHVEG